MSKDWFDQNMKDGLPDMMEGMDLDSNWKAIQAKRRKKRRKVIYFWLVLPTILLFLTASMVFTGHISLNSENNSESISEPTQVELALRTKDEKESFLQHRNDPLLPNLKNASQSLSADKGLNSQKSVQRVVVIAGSSSNQTVPRNMALQKTIPRESDFIQNDGLVDAEIRDLIISSAKSEVNHKVYSTAPAIVQYLPSRISYLLSEDTGIEIPVLNAYEIKEQKKMPGSTYWIGANVLYGLQSVKRNADGDVFAQRQEEEETLDVIQSGFEFGWDINAHFFLQTGLNFLQYTDRRQYETNQIYTLIDSNYLVSKLIRANGSMEDIYGVVEIPYVRNTREIQYNRYRFIELPVSAGMRYDLSPWISFRASAGASLGLIRSLSGSIAGQNDISISLDQANYKSFAQWSGIVRAEWVYQKPGWSAGIVLQGRTDLNNQLKTEAGYTEKRNAFSMGLCYRIHF